MRVQTARGRLGVSEANEQLNGMSTIFSDSTSSMAFGSETFGSRTDDEDEDTDDSPRSTNDSEGVDDIDVPQELKVGLTLDQLETHAVPVLSKTVRESLLDEKCGRESVAALAGRLSIIETVD